MRTRLAACARKTTGSCTGGAGAPRCERSGLEDAATNRTFSSSVQGEQQDYNRMRRRSVLFIIGKSYFQCVERICTFLERDSTVGLSLFEAATLTAARMICGTQTLITFVHSSVRTSCSHRPLTRTVPSLTPQNGMIEYRSSARRVQELFSLQAVAYRLHRSLWRSLETPALCAGTKPEHIFLTGSPPFDHYAQRPVPSDGRDATGLPVSRLAL